mgnify:CR=1 FL=1
MHEGRTDSPSCWSDAGVSAQRQALDVGDAIQFDNGRSKLQYDVDDDYDAAAA